MPAFQTVHPPNEKQPPPAQGIRPGYSGTLAVVGKYGIGKAVRSKAVPPVLLRKMLRIGGDHGITTKHLQMTGLVNIQLSHGDGTQPPATPGKVLHQAARPEHSRARRGRGKLMCFETADACAVIVVGKEDSGGQLEDLRLKFYVRGAMAEDQIRTPVRNL